MKEKNALSERRKGREDGLNQYMNVQRSSCLLIKEVFTDKRCI